MATNALFFSACFLFLSLFHLVSSAASTSSSEDQTTLTTFTKEPYSGWHSKAIQNPYPSPQQFNPDIDHFSFAILRNAPIEPEGFTLAVFESSPPDPNSDEPAGSPIAVDTSGRVLFIPDSTYAHFINLVSWINDLPSTGSFHNTWHVKQPTTSWPIDRLLVKIDSNSLQETSVQGYSNTQTELVKPVGEFTHLPDVLKQFFGLALESREDYTPTEVDSQMIEKVKKVLGVS